MRGNAISGAIKYRGTSQLPNPPTNIGIVIKKIIIKAWAVITVLYSCSLPINMPKWPISIRIIKDRATPTNPDHMAK